MEIKQFKGVPKSAWVVGPCQTSEIAKQVFAVADLYGWTWSDGSSYVENPVCNNKEYQTCYNLLNGTYGDLLTYEELECVIISPENFLANNPILKEQTKKMETIGSSKAKQNALPKKYTLEDWKREADAARKRAEYWKKQSNTWEQKYFVFQGNVNTEIEAIGQDLDSSLSSLKEAKTHLKWAQESNCELLERCKNAEALELASKAEIKVKNVEIGLLKYDFETKSSELEIIEEDYNQFKADSLHTRTLAWVGWIMFFISIFGMIFLRN